MGAGQSFARSEQRDQLKNAESGDDHTRFDQQAYTDTANCAAFLFLAVGRERNRMERRVSKAILERIQKCVRHLLRGSGSEDDILDIRGAPTFWKDLLCSGHLLLF